MSKNKENTNKKISDNTNQQKAAGVTSTVIKNKPGNNKIAKKLSDQVLY